MEQMEQTAHFPSPLPGQKQDILSPLKITLKSDSATTSKYPNQNKTRQPVLQLSIFF